MAKTLKIGSVGLGRLGYEHAKNIANYVTGAELTAICDTDAARVAQVAEELNVPYTYTDVAEMVKNPELDAIVVVSPSMFHAEHIKLALDAGKHCFCDKPLDTTVEKCKLAEKAVEAHPDKVFMLGFMRRFDDSYAEAKRRIDAGDIGKVVLVRSYTQDPRTTIEGTLKFAPHSGGQYLEGTTDITRTFALGPVTDEQKKHFTAVLCSMLNLANAKFLQGMTGIGLDILARGPIWDMGIDYRCGTGHGVSYLMSVHEGPNSFRWHKSPTRAEDTVQEPGMVTTDEPGVYIEGSHGIRTENELVCRKLEENEYGQFLGFETITCAPIDLDAVIPEQMSPRQRGWLNDYHAFVRETLLPLMQDDDERAWLKHATRAI